MPPSLWRILFLPLLIELMTWKLQQQSTEKSSLSFPKVSSTNWYEALLITYMSLVISLRWWTFFGHDLLSYNKCFTLFLAKNISTGKVNCLKQKFIFDFNAINADDNEVGTIHRHLPCDWRKFKAFEFWKGDSVLLFFYRGWRSECSSTIRESNIQIWTYSDQRLSWFSTTPWPVSPSVLRSWRSWVQKRNPASSTKTTATQGWAVENITEKRLIDPQWRTHESFMRWVVLQFQQYPLLPCPFAIF